MNSETLDCRGMKCPQPVLKVAILARNLAPGTLLEVQADCATFPEDIRKWCDKLGKVLVNCTNSGGTHHAQIQF